MSGKKHRGLRVFGSLIVVAFAVLFFNPSAPAQNVPPNPSGPSGHWRGHGKFPFSHHGGKVVTGAPYTAQAVTTMNQVLADGSHITRQITATIARDSQGRTMRSQSFNGFAAAGGTQKGATIVTIYDPVAGQRIEYNATTKTARIFVLPTSNAETPKWSPAQRHDRMNNSQVNVQTTSLGAQTISGVSAQGTRTTRTIAAGAIGNDKALQVIGEEWYSSDLQMVLQSTRTDPRFGETTYTVNNLQRTEPNASLFQVPAGYQTKTINVPSHSTPQ